MIVTTLQHLFGNRREAYHTIAFSVISRCPRGGNPAPRPPVFCFLRSLVLLLSFPLSYFTAWTLPDCAFVGPVSCEWSRHTKRFTSELAPSTFAHCSSELRLIE